MNDQPIITIDHIKPRTPNEGDELKGCFFQWVRDIGGLINVYNFFDREGQLIVGEVQVGARQPFNFLLPQVDDTIWVLNITSGSDTFVAGNWASVPRGFPIDDVVLDDDQSYQAQAGITPTYEDNTAAVTATATA